MSRRGGYLGGHTVLHGGNLGHADEEPTPVDKLRRMEQADRATTIRKFEAHAAELKRLDELFHSYGAINDGVRSRALDLTAAGAQLSSLREAADELKKKLQGAGLRFSPSRSPATLLQLIESLDFDMRCVRDGLLSGGFYRS